MSKYLYLLSKNQFKVIFFITSIVVLYGTLRLSQGVPLLNFTHGDKVLHAMAFFILAFLLNRSSSSIERRIRNIISLLGFGILIEVLQSFTTYRTASLGDVLADLLGILLFQLVYSALKSIQQKRKERRKKVRN